MANSLSQLISIFLKCFSSPELEDEVYKCLFYLLDLFLLLTPFYSVAGAM